MRYPPMQVMTKPIRNSPIPPGVPPTSVNERLSIKDPSPRDKTVSTNFLPFERQNPCLHQLSEVLLDNARNSFARRISSLRSMSRYCLGSKLLLVHSSTATRFCKSISVG